MNIQEQSFLIFLCFYKILLLKGLRTERNCLIFPPSMGKILDSLYSRLDS